MGRPRKGKEKAVAAGSSQVVDDAGITHVGGSSPDDAIPPKRLKRGAKNMASNGAKKATAARKPGRPAKKRIWEDVDFVTTNERSPIVNVDLIKTLSNPKAWEYLSEVEKQEIISLLPENVAREHHAQPTTDTESHAEPIPPLSPQFLRYGNGWREAVRNFQRDLECGRYEPEWQRQALIASKERAEGKFDKWKEGQFEEFWGQKQKFDRRIAAGDGASIKLSALASHGVLRVGDVWKYTATKGKGVERQLMEKEIKIVGWDGHSLTFAIPPGKCVFFDAVGKEASETIPPPAIAPVNGQRDTIGNRVIPNSQSSEASRRSASVIPDSQSTNSSKRTASVIPNSQSTEASMHAVRVIPNSQSTDASNTVVKSQTTVTDAKDGGYFLDFAMELKEAAQHSSQIEHPDASLEPSPSTATPNETPSRNIESKRTVGSDGAPVVLDSDQTASLGQMDIDSSALHEAEQIYLPYQDYQRLRSRHPSIFDTDESDILSSAPTDDEEVEIELPEIPFSRVKPQVEPLESATDSNSNSAHLIGGSLGIDAPKSPSRASPLATPSTGDVGADALDITANLPCRPGDINHIKGEVDSLETVIDIPDALVQPNDTSMIGASKEITSEPSHSNDDQGVIETSKSVDETPTEPVHSGVNRLVLLSRVTSPSYVARKIHEVNGLFEYVPHSNSWKDFRCFRENQDLGSLWEVRQDWYFRSKS
ncbi:hypothetical protein FQN57_002349 [Myotisia sp. PD_48]|nr:hypothetical protein FQN57_002349 [Myotisia sp. PD_48]